MSTALTVRAILDAPVAGIFTHPFMLDAPLSFAWFTREHQQGRTPPPVSEAPDANLPLHRWEQAGTWGWCTSKARYEIIKWGSMTLHKMPNMTANAALTRNPKFHRALGAEKARSSVIEIAWVTPLEWEVLATDEHELHTLLDAVTHVGSHTAIGLGHVTTWEITPNQNPNGWQDRPMPTPGVTGRYRAPYWHPSREHTPQTGEEPSC